MPVFGIPGLTVFWNPRLNSFYSAFRVPGSTSDADGKTLSERCRAKSHFGLRHSVKSYGKDVEVDMVADSGSNSGSCVLVLLPLPSLGGHAGQHGPTRQADACEVVARFG